MKISLFTKVLLVGACCCSVLSTSFITAANNSQKLLHRDLLAHYTAEERPGSMTNEKLTILTSLSLTAILDLDELRGEMVSVGYIQLSWVDKRLTWDPLEYGGLYTAFFHPKKVVCFSVVFSLACV